MKEKSLKIRSFIHYYVSLQKLKTGNNVLYNLCFLVYFLIAAFSSALCDFRYIVFLYISNSRISEEGGKEQSVNIVS